MNLTDWVAWGTIAGGLAGFFSFGVVLFDKITQKPKLITSVRSASFKNEGGEPMGVGRRIRFEVKLEIGNVGREQTTITSVVLALSEVKLKAVTFEHLAGGISFIVEEYQTRLCEKGVASIERLFFYKEGSSSDAKEIQGTIELTLIGGRKHTQLVVFQREKSQQEA